VKNHLLAQLADICVQKDPNAQVFQIKIFGFLLDNIYDTLSIRQMVFRVTDILYTMVPLIVNLLTTILPTKVRLL